MNETIGKVIEQIAIGAGTTPEHLFDVMARQVFINGVMNLVLMCIGIMAIYLLWTWFMKELNCRINFEKNKEAFVPMMLAAVFVCASIVAWIVKVLPDSISSVANPEYKVVVQITRDIK